jgi:hypothetical protein
MGITISKALIAKLPESERVDIENQLWLKSGSHCHLCDAEFNRATDDIEADHDVPESEGGATSYENLNLAHVRCNRAKRAAKTLDIRPYLRIKAFASNRDSIDRYDAYLSHFDIKPQPTVIEVSNDTVTFELPDGTRRNTPVFYDHAGSQEIRYTFVPLPRNAIFNDDACQPRAVKLEHAQAIYIDIQTNVLHEPPSCRLEQFDLGKPVRLLMFDGQHKTIASWMNGQSHVTCKVYLDLPLPLAIQLVNSIQAKIRKLPLSPFELTAKMADEWQNKWGEYETEVGSDSVSEKGFVAWLPQAERNRGKAALQSALVQNVLGDSDLRLRRYVVHPATKTKPPIEITEQALKSKVIERLLARAPQPDQGAGAQHVREQEARNIVRILNTLNDHAFEPDEGEAELSPVALERAKRMKYQSSLAYISTLLKRSWMQVAGTDQDDPMSKSLTDKEWAELEGFIKRLAEHPVWTAEYDDRPFMGKIKQALEKNQDAKEAFEGAALTFSYMLAGREDAMYKQAWQ